jgi:uncharacterized delta-60 repeat protein
MNHHRGDRTYLRAAFIVGISMAVWAAARAQEQGNSDGKQKSSATGQFSIVHDATFGKGGLVAEHSNPKAPKHDGFRSLAIDRLGRSVGAGNSTGQRFALARYTLDGRPDDSFGDTGKTSVCIEDQETVDAAGAAEVQFTYDMTIDSKGRVLVVGKGAGIDPGRKSDFALLRFNEDGSLDQTLGGVGHRKYQAHDSPNAGLAVAAAADCSTFVVAGYAQIEGSRAIDPLLIRFTEAGTVDEAFSGAANGSLRWLAKDNTPATPTGVAIDRLGRYLVALNIQRGRRSTWALARLNSDGEIDDTFGDAGLWSAPLDESATSELACSATIDDAGRIVLGGYSEDENGYRRLAIARINDRGQLDPAFGPDGKGCVVLIGYGANVTHRFGPRAAVFKNRIAVTGSLNAASGNSRCFGVAVMDDSGQNVAKLAPRAFPGSKGNDQPWGIAFDNNGRIVVAGMSQSPSGKWRFAIARYIIK